MKNNIRLKTKDEYFMNIALQEAAKANHEVFPNPKVGAIVVVDNNIISSGYHKFYGEEHAEANAINKLPDLPEMMEKANQALTFLASGGIPQSSNSYSAFKDKQLELKSFRNQTIIGIIALVFFSILVF